MKTSNVQKLYSDYLLPTYAQLPICLVKGKGARVWDLQGKEYLDFFPGWAVSGLGHCHPAVVNAVKDQAKKIMHISNNFLNLKQGLLAEEISRNSFPARLFFCNSGAEANEAAIKFARKRGSSSGRYEIITFHYSFHGRTLGALAATSQKKIQSGFEPLLTGFRYAEFNSLNSVKSCLNEKTAGILLEPLQGEGGVQTATPEFMKGLRKICDENNILLMLDEVQTGMGRTGKMFAFQHYGIEPDVMTLAKSLGNGVPIGALVVNKRVKEDVFTPGSHGSTYGGNPLVAAAALAVFKVIKKEKLLQKAEVLGNYLNERLESMKEKFPVIQELRGKALMRGVVLSETGADLVALARANGLLINCTQDKILRILPPMTISKAFLRKGLDILETSFEKWGK